MDGASGGWCAVVGLCGLPGAGKSTLAECLTEHCRCLTPPVRVVHVEFDFVEREVVRSNSNNNGADDVARVGDRLARELLARSCRKEGEEGNGEVGHEPQQFDVGAWRTSRLVASQTIQALIRALGKEEGQRSLVVCDDNLHYASMRKGLCKLARDEGAGFVVVYLSADVATCVGRNSRRPNPVPPFVIERMAQLLEPPNGAQGRYCDQHTVVVPAGPLVAIEQVVGSVLALACKPSPLPAQDEVDAEQQESDRRQTQASQVHQADLRLRALVKATMDQLVSRNACAEEKAAAAKSLNQSRKEVLELVKGGEWDGSLDELQQLFLQRASA